MFVVPSWRARTVGGTFRGPHPDVMRRVPDEGGAPAPCFRFLRPSTVASVVSHHLQRLRTRVQARLPLAQGSGPSATRPSRSGRAGRGTRRPGAPEPAAGRIPCRARRPFPPPWPRAPRSPLLPRHPTTRLETSLSGQRARRQRSAHRSSFSALYSPTMMPAPMFCCTPRLLDWCFAR